MLKLSIAQQFEHIFKVISSNRFIKMLGLGNEVPFFICPYEPSDFFEYEAGIDTFLVKRLQTEANIRVKTINIYDLAIQHIKDEGYWEVFLENEKDTDKEDFYNDLKNALDPEDTLVPLIGQQIEDSSDFDVLFLTGVGQVFPYVRSHTVLNNLQRVAKAKPTVIFFPGKYRKSPSGGTSLDLFGELQDNKYYRAFNIFEYEA